LLNVTAFVTDPAVVADVAVVAVVAVAALPPIERADAVPVRPVPAPVNAVAVTVPTTWRVVDGEVVPIPTLPPLNE
jgi:hypothetical protein